MFNLFNDKGEMMIQCFHGVYEPVETHSCAQCKEMAESAQLPNREDGYIFQSYAQFLRAKAKAQEAL